MLVTCDRRGRFKFNTHLHMHIIGEQSRTKENRVEWSRAASAAFLSDVYGGVCHGNHEGESTNHHSETRLAVRPRTIEQRRTE